MRSYSTPEVLISAPRRSPAIPNSSGTLALFTTSTYSFETHSKSQELRVLDIKTGQSTVLTSESGVSDPTWVPNGDSEDEGIVLWLQGAEKGVTKLIVADANTGKV
jgi:dipeptidyl aminopeptidase/acylaminoacyl peptidase